MLVTCTLGTILRYLLLPEAKREQEWMTEATGPSPVTRL